MNTRYYKWRIEKVIKQQPTLIKIKRTSKEDDGFSGATVKETTLRLQKIRIYDKKVQRETILDKGATFPPVTTLKFLAKEAANIEEGDTFMWEQKTVRVVFVQTHHNICKQGELEVIA